MMTTSSLLSQALDAVGAEKVYAALGEEQRRALPYIWNVWARPDQSPPTGDWSVWVLRGGRGSGKTRAGAEWVRGLVESGAARRVAIVAPTAADARDVMVEGESGILAVCPPWNRPAYEPTKRRLTWPALGLPSDGAMATVYSADEPDRLRGPQHDAAWCDELAAWRRPEAFDMLMFGLRLGDAPRCVVTTTPKPVRHFLALLKTEHVVETTATTYANLANLAPSWRSQILSRYEGTRLGRQELEAEILTDDPGALWRRESIDESRVTEVPDLDRVIVGVDPPGSATGAECGIVVAGRAGDEYWVLDDRSCHGTPQTWGSAVIAAYHAHAADRIAVEVNFGGDMVRQTLSSINPIAVVKAVRAARGKAIRAEPIAALYEQGRVHHVGYYADLEDELCQWVPGDRRSPNRLDALVWALAELSGRVVSLDGVTIESLTARSSWRW